MVSLQRFVQTLFYLMLAGYVALALLLIVNPILRALTAARQEHGPSPDEVMITVYRRHHEQTQTNTRTL
jgi:hypothetical protein